jgi:membrane protein
VALWVDLFKRHNLLTYASAIAFQALVALVALTLLGIGVLGAIGRRDVWTNQLAPQIEPKVLLEVFGGIDATVEKIFESSSGGLIAFAAVLTIWEMSGVVRACMGAMAQIYEDEETRPWWIRFPVSIAIAFALTVALVGAVLLATAARTAVHGAWGIPFAILRWLVALGLITLAFGLLVRFAPQRRRAKRWVSVGATLAVAGWLVEAVLFRVWLTSVANFKTAVGSLAVLLFVTAYFYVAAIILLVAIELDELLREDAGAAERALHELF